MKRLSVRLSVCPIDRQRRAARLLSRPHSGKARTQKRRKKWMKKVRTTEVVNDSDCHFPPCG